MSDFFQNGNVSTLHNLTRRSVEDMEAELVNFPPIDLSGLYCRLCIPNWKHRRSKILFPNLPKCLI